MTTTHSVTLAGNMVWQATIVKDANKSYSVDPALTQEKNPLQLGALKTCKPSEISQQCFSGMWLKVGLTSDRLK